MHRAGGIAGGDETFVTEIYVRCFPPLMRVAYLMTGSNELAEDAVQEAFLRYRSRLRGLDHPESYLKAAVVNECRSLHRREIRRHLDQPVAEEQTPIELIELRDALRRLPGRQRAAIVLRYFVDIPDTEIAEVLGCRPSTVRSLIRRGVASLKEVLS